MSREEDIREWNKRAAESGIDFVKRAAARDGPDSMAATVLRLRELEAQALVRDAVHRTPLYRAMHSTPTSRLKGTKK